MQWHTIEVAAEILSFSRSGLWKLIARHARLIGGVNEARFDGLICRKIGRTWRVCICETRPKDELKAVDGGSVRSSVTVAKKAADRAPKGA